jgi:hypothetical protein
MSKRLLWWNSKLDDCVENVAFGDGIAYKIVNAELRALIERYVQIDMVGMKNARPRRFPGGLPVAIFRAQLPLLTQGLHLWAPKTKGTRYRFLALKLCSDVSFIDDTCTGMNHSNAVVVPTPSIVHQEIAALPAPDQTIPLIGTKKKYKKKKKNAATMLDEEDEKLSPLDAITRKELVETLEAKLEMEKKNAAAATLAALEEVSSEEESDSDEDEEEMKEVSDTRVTTATVATLQPAAQRTIKAVQYLHALMDRSGEIFALPNFMLPESIYPALLDGELARHKQTGLHHFLVFNISVSNGYPWCNWRYQERVKEYTQFCTLFTNNEAVTQNAPIAKIVAKPQYQWYAYDRVFYESRFGEYECDGTTATRNKTKAIEHGTDWNSFKIKPLKEQTTDLVAGIMDTSIGADKLFLLGGGYLNKQSQLMDVDTLYPECEQSIYRFFRNRIKFPVEWIQNSSNWNGKVFESLFNEKSNDYEAIDIRADKQHPNNARVIQFTKQNIREGVTPEEVYELWKKWQQGEQHEKIKTLQLAQQSNRMMEKHHMKTHEDDFMKTMFAESNLSQMPSHSLSACMTSLKLSWELQTVDEVEEEAKRIYPVSCFPPAAPEFNAEQLKLILNVDHLKPIVKNKRKGRKKDVASEGKRKKAKLSLVDDLSAEMDDSIDEVEESSVLLDEASVASAAEEEESLQQEEENQSVQEGDENIEEEAEESVEICHTHVEESSDESSEEEVITPRYMTRSRSLSKSK